MSYSCERCWKWLSWRNEERMTETKLLKAHWGKQKTWQPDQPAATRRRALTLSSDRPPIKNIVSVANTIERVWGDEIAASEEGESVWSKTSERQWVSTYWSANELVSERYMQGRPKGVHFTLADMFLRNKTERLTNTALPALGCALGKASVWLNGLECNGKEWRSALAVWCRKWVNVKSEVRTNAMNLLEAHGWGWGYFANLKILVAPLNTIMKTTEPITKSGILLSK